MSVEKTAPAQRFRLRPMVGRDPNQSHRAASPLELLFDLTFVAAFAQASDQLAEFLARGHVAAGVWGFAFIMISITWAWISYTWFASAFDTDDWLQRVLTVVQMVGVVVLALGVPDVFHSIDDGESLDYRIVAAGYVIMRISMIVMWARVARQDAANRRTALLYIVFTAGAQLGWLALLLLRVESVALLSTLVVLLWVVELLGPVVSTWEGAARGDAWHGTPWHARHIAERYGLFVIIALGEVVLGTIAAVAAVVAHVGWSTEAVLIVVAGIGTTLGLWWTYFIFPSGTVLARHRSRKWAWSYGHIALFGSVAAVGAGIRVAAFAAQGEATIGTVGVVLSTAVPVLAFCLLYFGLWSILFRAVDPFHVGLAVGMIMFLALAVVLALFGVPLGWCLFVVMLSPMVVIVGYETGGYRHVEADIAREG
ncbi:low temperature requirement protein A [Gryllotalpicola koreensis]|uniref:low temperature requirement protein A n=1 Tax=Gryllotalpicola koreensis TaxID=993086 RepID=UPI0031E2DF21